MDKVCGNAAWTWHVEIQHGHAEWAGSIDMQHGYAEWKSKVEMQHGHALWTCSMGVDMQHGYGNAAGTWMIFFKFQLPTVIHSAPTDRRTDGGSIAFTKQYI
jgi:hypothetical protein